MQALPWFCECNFKRAETTSYVVAVWAACRIPTTSGSLLPGSPKYDLGGVVAGAGGEPHLQGEKIPGEQQV